MDMAEPDLLALDVSTQAFTKDQFDRLVSVVCYSESEPNFISIDTLPPSSKVRHTCSRG
jgi:hypothetical protein